MTRYQRCSTPCGINGILTYASHCEHRQAARCSTPCGINGILTLYPQASRRANRLVLNALRHQWNPHLATSPEQRDGTSAQRLAASMESSPRDVTSTAVIAGAQRLAASMESSQRPIVIALGEGGVLNALRHQWNPHMIGSGFLSGSAGAQRLAASMESSRGVLAHSRQFACAQRLAASMESSLR